MRGILIGFGNMGQTHWEQYRNLGVELSAVIEVDPVKVEFAESKGLKVYSSLQKGPHVAKADFIDICTPTHLHFKHIQEAAHFGKPLLVEKPVVRTEEEAKKLKEMNYPHFIFVGEVEHYNPKLKPFFDCQGTPKKITIHREVNLELFLEGAIPWFLDEKQSGGIVLDLMIHDINLLVAKYGKPSVKAVVFQKKKYDCVDEVEVILRFGGFDAALFSSWTATQKNLITTRVEIENQEDSFTRIFCDDYQEAFLFELRAFVQAVETGSRPYPLDVYLRAFEVAQEILKKMH